MIGILRRTPQSELAVGAIAVVSLSASANSSARDTAADWGFAENPELQVPVGVRKMNRPIQVMTSMVKRPIGHRMGSEVVEHVTTEERRPEPPLLVSVGNSQFVDVEPCASERIVHGFYQRRNAMDEMINVSHGAILSQHHDNIAANATSACPTTSETIRGSRINELVDELLRRFVQLHIKPALKPKYS